MSDSSTASEIHPALAKLSGTILEQRYELGRMLGAGGMGAVFEATQLRLDRKVAIKVLRPVFVGHDEFIKRFLREAKAASRIEHRNVVEILDYGEAEGGLIYSVMKFLDGQDLAQLLRGQPDQRLPWDQAWPLLAQIAAGLKAAHAQGVIHRDIKPANVIAVREDDEVVVKVVDFGIAKVDAADQTQQLTGTAEVLGTPAYIAPELVRTKGPASPRSDVYSLGVLAYRMLSGRVPFSGETAFAVLHQSCYEPVRPLREHVPEISEAVEAFVLSMLAKEPGDRPSDMLAVRQGLVALGGATLGPKAVEVVGSGALSLELRGAGAGAEVTKTTPLPMSTDMLVEGSGPRYSPSPTEVLETPVDLTPTGEAVTGEGGVATVVGTQVVTAEESEALVAVADQGEDEVAAEGWMTRWPLLLLGLVFVGAVVGAMVWVGAGEDEDGAVVGETKVADGAVAVVEPAVELEPAVEPKPAVKPEPELEPEPEPEVKPEPAVKPEPVKKKTLDRRPPRPPRPPSDAQIIKRLKSKIRTKCAASLSG